jgi:hypothetical protein
VQVPLYASFLSDAPVGDSLVVRTELYGWNTLGERRTYDSQTRRIAYRPWMSAPLAPLAVTMPREPAVVVLAVRLEDATGTVLHHNFTTFVVDGAAPTEVTLADGPRARVARVGAGSFTKAEWSRKTWTVLDGLKANGAGSGYFEYRIPWPAGLRREDVAGATFLVEASAKQLYGKDRDSTTREEGDYMRGGGFQDPSRNRNAYPMTDETKYPSAVTVRVLQRAVGRFELADDPADHRGILSWHSQKRDRFLREAGSYGELIRVAIPDESLDAAAKLGEVVVRLEVSDALPGGLAIYGSKFGRYPVDPTVLFIMKDRTEVARPR